MYLCPLNRFLYSTSALLSWAVEGYLSLRECVVMVLVVRLAGWSAAVGGMLLNFS